MRAMRASDYAYLSAALPIALAHRGGTTHPANVGIENTVTAFTNAVNLGFRYLETDVHASSDGVLVAFHDVSLDRVTDRVGAIADTPYSVIAQARIGGTERIPLLADLLQTFPDARFNIDVKSDLALEPTIATIRDHTAYDRVCVGSFSRRRVTALREALPGVATAAGQLGSAALRFSPARLSALLHTPAPVLQIPARYRVRGREIALVTSGLVQRAHDLGKQVHVWFYPWSHQDADEMHRLLDLGVDGLVVDDLLTLREVFTERGHPLP